WRFPYITGQYGGAIFVIIYLAFLLGVGVPLLTVELAIGRASRRSIAKAFDILEAPGTKWHLNKFWLIPGSYILMSFYGLITGWMLYYCVKFTGGAFEPGLTQEAASQNFGQLLSNPLVMFVCMTTVTVVSFVIVAMGVDRGLEHITKPLMILLLALLAFMSVRSVTLDGFAEGISYYLKPDWSRLEEHGFMQALWAAMGQAFFTLSVGQGSIEIFGTYVNKRHTLLSEACWIAGLDTIVALLAGFVIFPACFSYGVQPDSGPSLLFVTMNTVFANMAGGRFWGALFFLFMLIAAMSTLIAVYESIIAICMEVFGISRLKSVAVNFAIIMVISIPPLLGFNVLDWIHPMGGSSSIMDLQDFLISNNILPLGSLFMVIFITARTGMQWKRYVAEVNEGEGPRLSARLYWYFKLVLPAIIAILLAVGYVNIFS
ncbi:MAG: sodium-dependent transporter, partial [Succinivibrio sp.]